MIPLNDPVPDTDSARGARHSVVVLSTGQEETLSRAVTALRDQLSDREVEVVVVCASRDAEQRGREFADAGARIVVAPPAAPEALLRGIGLAEAHGDVVTFVWDRQLALPHS